MRKWTLGNFPGASGAYYTASHAGLIRCFRGQKMLDVILALVPNGAAQRPSMTSPGTAGALAPVSTKKGPF